MTPAAVLLIAVIAPALTVFGIVYSAGRWEGRTAARLTEIERRLGEIESVLKRLGFPFRQHERGMED